MDAIQEPSEIDIAGCVDRPQVRVIGMLAEEGFVFRDVSDVTTAAASEYRLVIYLLLILIVRLRTTLIVVEPVSI